MWQHPAEAGGWGVANIKLNRFLLTIDIHFNPGTIKCFIVSLAIVHTGTNPGGIDQKNP